MIELAKKLNLDNALIRRLEDMTRLERNTVSHLSALCENNHFNILNIFNHKIRLAVILTLAKSVKSKYLEFGISEDIYYATMSDIKIWCENNGNKGLKIFGWLKNHVTFSLFKVGRLQFQLSHFGGESKVMRTGIDVKNGDGIVYIHIPADGKLNIDDCKRSLLLSKSFIENTFKEYSFKYYICDSWLLYEGNKAFMDSKSNIISFANLFEHKYSYESVQAIKYIFGKKKFSNNKYKEDTSLQRNVKKHLLAGGKLGAGIGIIDKNSL